MIYVRNGLLLLGLPLDFQNGGRRPEIGLPILLLWEFILAGISRGRHRSFGCSSAFAMAVSSTGILGNFLPVSCAFGSNAAARRVIWIVLPLVLTSVYHPTAISMGSARQRRSAGVLISGQHPSC